MLSMGWEIINIILFTESILLREPSASMLFIRKAQGSMV